MYIFSANRSAVSPVMIQLDEYQDGAKVPMMMTGVIPMKKSIPRAPLRRQKLP
jgi:hypothetical protein